VIGLMRAGERASKLSDACSSAADQLEHEAELEADIRSSLAYPVLILLVGLASVLVMGVVVIPRFAELIGDLGGEIPAGASLLIAASEFIASHGLAAGIGSGVLLAAFIRGLGAPGIRPRLDAALLRLPGVGGLRLAFASARTCRALGAMLSSGMPLLEALDATADAAGDLEVKRRFELARADVRGGRPLAASLADHRAVAPLALQLIGVGEASGRLAQMTRRAGDISAERARRALQAAVSLLEPLLVVVLGVLVAVVAAILLQAVYSVRAV
jgi:type II secretory pathway component PulF